MTSREYRPGYKVVVAAVLIVAATYGYFLIFAQFAFLKMVQGSAGAALKPITATMGLAGMAGSALAAWVYRVQRSQMLLAAGFAACAGAAGSALAARSGGEFLMVALLVGLGAGFATVTLAAALRRVVGAARLGTVIGLGTGLAYGLCNLPAVFQAAAATQTEWAVVIALTGLAGTFALTVNDKEPVPVGADYARGGIVAWVVILFALVALDSAAFSIFQHTPELLANTWSGAGRLEANAGIHFGAALWAGLALDRRWVGRTVAFGAVALLAACALFVAGQERYFGTVFLYSAGVSVYSTVLVFYPASGLRPGLAAVVCAVAGWGGSALGLALAENRQAVPGWWVAVAGTVIAGALLGRAALRVRPVLARQ